MTWHQEEKRKTKQKIFANAEVVRLAKNKKNVR